MKFLLVDRISELEPGRRIVAHKALTLAEEYLADHFPTFPVLPGVLMLEALVQASAWLVRATQDFAPAFVLLREARNVTYQSFLAPGRVLAIESVCTEMLPHESSFTAHGTVDGRECVKGRLTLRHLNLADSDASLAEIDQRTRRHLRALFDQLWGGRAAEAAASGSRV